MTGNLPRTVIQTNVLLLAASFFLFLSCNSKAPEIKSINPKTGRMGEIVTLTGINFGETREESYVTIAGVAPTGSSYFLWQDDIIMLRVPEMGESGLIYVHTEGKKSNGVLFSNSASVPRPVEGEELGFNPRITSVTPQAGPPGTIITITGSNFGGSSEGGGVYFSWDYESRINPYLVKEPEFIEVSETELGYISWTTREIQVRLPDGAVSGNVEVRTPNGRSHPVYFNITGKPGNKIFTEKRSYTISYSIDIRVLHATKPNTLYLWIPKPVTSSSQRNVSMIFRNMEPFIENHRGVSLFKLDGLETDTNYSVSFSFSADIYSVETQISPQSVNNEPNAISTLYTQNSDIVPVNNPMIRETVNSIIGREQNPYNKARLIYNWMLKNIQVFEVIPYSENIARAIELKSADPYTTALLYTAMARAAGVPCIPVAGVLINHNLKTFRHYWSEIWINDFGWMPVDPSLGAGFTVENFTNREDPAAFYFGNIDNQRIAFSRGELQLAQMESRGRLVSVNQSYSLQNIWEEASGGLDSYTSLWGDIIISGIYVQ
ncbi:MAG: IPT/TIG domain-containing protein [Treponema sp.]|nr:IPT/TIG domain-containing protein [Treponema sp.]